MLVRYTSPEMGSRAAGDTFLGGSLRKEVTRFCRGWGSEMRESCLARAGLGTETWDGHIWGP